MIINARLDPGVDWDQGSSCFGNRENVVSMTRLDAIL